MSNYPCSVVFSLDQSLSYPHYSDDRWKDTLTVYDRKPSESVKDIHWQYDDRLSQYDYEKHKRGLEKAKLQKDNTGRYWLEYLKGYYDSDIELIWIGAEWLSLLGFCIPNFGERKSITHMWKYNSNSKTWNRTLQTEFYSIEFSISYDENLRFHYLNWEFNGDKKEKTLHVTDIDLAQEIADAFISITF